ncbi:MAG: serine/threonine protein kinase [Myxococcales bacterium]|nr:serine/threonine protein kinase [Myxococcales bacterium]
MNAGDLISGKYRLQRVLGAGSMGSVWAARNELTNRDFAVKFLLPELSRNQDALQRFFLEARACGQIRHPAIVDVYDMGQAEDGSPYLVMELLEGEGFDQRLARQGYMRPVDVCRYIAIIARGLEEAHTRGLIHRDLKPGNIFFAIDKSGEVFPRVLDFGISKETDAEQFDYVKTSTGAVLGSPAYMSPEQAKGELDVDARTDIWALGVIMYEALTGRVPFDANNYNALMVRIITAEHTPVLDLVPTVPPALSALVDQLLEKDPDKRVGSAGELATRLERIYATITQTPLARPERLVSLAPPGEAITQHGWFQVRTASGQSRVSPGVLMGAAIALLGLVGGGLALAMSPADVKAAERLEPEVNLLVARAEKDYAEAMAKVQTAEAEKARQDAERRAEEAIRRQEDGEEKKVVPGPRVAPGPQPDDVHGGVSGPGF